MMVEIDYPYRVGETWVVGRAALEVRSPGEAPRPAFSLDHMHGRHFFAIGTDIYERIDAWGPAIPELLPEHLRWFSDRVCAAPPMFNTAFPDLDAPWLLRDALAEDDLDPRVRAQAAMRTAAEQARRAVEAGAASLAIHGGRVYRKSGPPVLVASRRQSEKVAHLFAWMLDPRCFRDWLSADLANDSVFLLGERRQAVEKARSLTSRYFSRTRIELHDDRAAVFDLSAHACRHSAAALAAAVKRRSARKLAKDDDYLLATGALAAVAADPAANSAAMVGPMRSVLASLGGSLAARKEAAKEGVAEAVEGFAATLARASERIGSGVAEAHDTRLSAADHEALAALT